MPEKKTSVQNENWQKPRQKPKTTKRSTKKCAWMRAAQMMLLKEEAKCSSKFVENNFFFLASHSAIHNGCTSRSLAVGTFKRRRLNTCYDFRNFVGSFFHCDFVSVAHLSEAKDLFRQKMGFFFIFLSLCTLLDYCSSHVQIYIHGFITIRAIRRSYNT